jgi:uncharacterized protein (DUF2249 family)
LDQAGFTQENPEALRLAIQRQATDKETIEFVPHPSDGEECCVPDEIDFL